MESSSKLTVSTAVSTTMLNLPVYDANPSLGSEGMVAYIDGEMKIYSDKSGTAEWGSLVQQETSLIQTANLISWIDPTMYIAGASTWQDKISGTAWTVTGSTTKDNDYQIKPSSGTIYFRNGRAQAMEVGGGNLTYECWWYCETTNFGSWRYIIGKSSFWDANSSGIYINSNGQSIGFHTTSTNGIEYSLSSMGTGWKHLAAVMDGTGRKLYVNGNLVTSDSTRHNQSSTTNLSFLCDNEGEYADSRFRGGHARFYNVALPQTQIQLHYNSEKAFYGL